MRRGVYTTEIKATIDQLKSFIEQLGEVDIIHVVQSQAIIGSEAKTSMTVVYKNGEEKKDKKEKDQVSLNELIEIFERINVPKDIDSLRGSYKKLKETLDIMAMRLLAEALKIESGSPTRAVNLILQEKLSTMEVASIIKKLLKGMPEEKILDSLVKIYDWAKTRRP